MTKRTYQTNHNFQGTGRPWLLTGTLASADFGTNQAEVEINFPYPQRWISVRHWTGSAGLGIRFHSLTGSEDAGACTVPLKQDESQGFYSPVSKIYLHLLSNASDVEYNIVGEGVPTKESFVPPLTGSGISSTGSTDW